MKLSLAFSPSAAGYFLFATLAFVVLKLAATVLQVALARGDSRRLPKTMLFRIAYVCGKASPALAAACACVAAALRHDTVSAWFLGLLAVLVAMLAIYVVHLRKQGRFFGLLDTMASSDAPDLRIDEPSRVKPARAGDASQAARQSDGIENYSGLPANRLGRAAAIGEINEAAAAGWAGEANEK